MKKLKYLLLFVFAGFSFFIINVKAESTNYRYECDGVYNNNEISVAEEKMWECRDLINNPVSVENNVIYNGNITREYQVHIYHFYIPRDGNYTAYTTGDKDTLVRFCRENQVLWWCQGFIWYDTVDDGSLCDYNKRNACDIQFFTKGYYYVAVRLYGSSTGEYTINIAPNEDLLYRGNNNYTRWECVSNNPTYSNQGIFTDFIHYYTYEQTVMFYWLLTEESYSLGDYAEKYGMYSITPSELINMKKNDILEYTRIVADLSSHISSFLNLSMAKSAVIDTLTTTIDILADIKDMTKNALINNLKSKCGFHSTLINFDTMKISFDYCLALKQWHTSDVPTAIFGHNYDVIPYNSNDIYFRGEKYAKGNWKNI